MEPNKQTILVADDDPLIREALNDRLESMGYQVVLALDGNQVLQIIDKQTLHMTFLDIGMPDIKGMELLKEIRRAMDKISVLLCMRIELESTSGFPG